MGQPATTPALQLSDLKVPDQAKLSAVVARLSEKGKSEFIAELVSAIAVAAESDSAAPVQFVLDAWWASGIFASHPRFKKAWDAAGKTLDTDRAYTYDELVERFAS